MGADYNDVEIRALVRSITTSLPYCAPEAVDKLIYDKLSPLFFSLRSAIRRIAELELELLAEGDGDTVADENGEVDTEGLMWYGILCRDGQEVEE